MDLQQRLRLQALNNGLRLLRPPLPSEHPASAVGWDRATASPVVAIAGAHQPIRAIKPSGLALGQSVQVSAGDFGDWA